MLVTACGERSEPTGPQADLFPITITSADDRTVELPAPVRRVALLDPAEKAMLTDYRADVDVPVSSNGTLDEQLLREFAPDLVVTSRATGEQELSRAAAVAPVYVIADSSVREVERTLSELGAMLADPTTARRLVTDIERRRAAVVRAVHSLPRTSVFVDLGSFTTAPDRSLTGDLIRLAGGDNVAADVPDGGPFDLTELRRADPGVYVATTDSGTTLESLRADRRTRNISAVRAGRVLFLDPSELQPGPHIGRTLELLAQALHPDAIP
jgi:iron complex transport system substrate-binding protein